MDMLWHRKGALFCLLFVYTGFAAAFFSLAVLLLSLFIAAVLLALSFLPPIRALFSFPAHPRFISLLRLSLTAVAISVAFFSWYQWRTFDRPIRELDGTTAEITAVIRDTSYATAFSTAYTADVILESGETVRVLLETDASGLEAGDQVSATAKFSVIPEYSGSFPERRYYYSMNTSLSAEATDVTYIDKTEGGLRSFFIGWRESLVGILRADLGREGSALAAALFLGDRTTLADSLNRDFRRLGISHLLAISGLHFTILLGGLEKALRPLIPSKKLRALILSAADVGYMFLCGLSATVARAGIMMLITHTALFFNRRSDTVTSLGIASFLMCIVDPAAFYSVGLQLSVTAVLALCVFSHITDTLRTDVPVSRVRRTVRKALTAFFLPIVVQIALLPLLCLYFGEVSLLTPLAAVLFTPLVNLLLLLTPIYLIARPLAPVACALGTVIKGISECTHVLAGSLASLRGITLSLSYSFAPFYAAALFALMMATPLCRSRRPLKKLLSTIIAVCLMFATSIITENILSANQVKIISVVKGKNDAVIVMTAGDTMLIDISDGSYGAMHAAYRQAASNGTTELETLYLTHLHNRHVDGISRLCDATYVRSILLPSPTTPDEATVYSSISAFAKERSIPIYTYEAEDTVRFGDSAEILSEKRESISRSTHPIIAFSIRAGENTFVYLGAAATEIPAYAEKTATDMLVFGTHGPLYKTNIAISSLPDDLRVAVFRGDSVNYISAELKQALVGTDVRTSAETVSYILAP